MRSLRDQNSLVKVHTDFGQFVIELYKQAAPITANNFLRYVDAGFLNDCAIHRIVTRDNQQLSVKHKIEVVQWDVTDPLKLFPPISILCFTLSC